MTITKPIFKYLPYQDKWRRDKSRFKIGLMSRQVGKTLSTARGDVADDCIMAEIEGQRTSWLVLSSGERQAKEVIDKDIKPHCEAFYTIYKDLMKNKGFPEFVESDFKGDSGAVYRALDVVFPGGSIITALPSNPDTARGYSRKIFADEFSTHQKSNEVWAAILPIISRPGLRIVVTGTPKGRKNKFYELWTDKSGIWSKHIVTIHDAVEQGLDRNVEELRAAIGNEYLWRQEFLCEFLDEGFAWLPYEMILACEHVEAGRSGKYQGGDCYIGNDIARRNDLWVAWVVEMVGDVRWTREIVVLRNATFREQDAALDTLMQKYKVIRVAMDQTGMGEKPVEDAKQRYGSTRVEGVIMSSSRRLDIATAGKQCFEDRLLRIPEGDAELRADLHKPQMVSGPTGAPRIVAESDGAGHADRFWACNLALAASMGGYREYAYTPARPTDDDGDDDDRPLFGPGCF